MRRRLLNQHRRRPNPILERRFNSSVTEAGEEDAAGVAEAEEATAAVASVMAVARASEEAASAVAAAHASEEVASAVAVAVSVAAAPACAKAGLA